MYIAYVNGELTYLLDVKILYMEVMYPNIMNTFCQLLDNHFKKIQMRVMFFLLILLINFVSL